MTEQATVVEAGLDRDTVFATGCDGDVGAFLTIADRALAEWPGDAELRMLAVRRLAEQGLLYRAARVAEGFPDVMRSDDGFAAMLRELDAPRNNGLASWDRYSTQFEDNLAALRGRYDWADDMLLAWQGARDRLELHRTTTEQWQVFDRGWEGAGGWRPGFGEHRPQQAVEEIASLVANKVVAPIVIDGVGLGHDLPHMYAATRSTLHGACPIIYLIETSPAAIAVALHLNDWREMIADDRVRFCVGEAAHDNFACLLAGDDWAALPQTVVRPLPWDPNLAGRVEQCLAKITEQVRQRVDDVRAEATGKYRHRDAAYWRRRFTSALAGGDQPLRVLGLTSLFTTVLQYSTRDALRAFASLGCETRLLIEPNNHSCVTPEKMLATVAAFEPDLVVAIDHTRASQAVGLIAEVPFLTWIQDRLPWLFDAASGRSMGPLDFCMGFARGELVERCEYPAARFLSCEMATDPGAFVADDGGEIDDGRSDGTTHLAVRADDAAGGASRLACDAARFACDVAYATHSSESPDRFHEAARRRCGGDQDRRLLDAMRDELTAISTRGELNGGLRFDAFLERMEQATGIQVEAQARHDLIGNYVRIMVDRLLRHQTIEWASNWAEAGGHRFHLYGNGWNDHPRFAVYARGTLSHGPELGTAFRGAAVNLHAGCNTALHQRVLDGLAAGGFFLIRRHAGDVSYRVSRAIHEFVRANDLHPPALVGWKDLPSPLDKAFRALRRMNGLDPDAAVELGEAHFANLRAIHEDGTVLLASQLWPDFEGVTFGTEAEFVERLEWFLSHSEERRTIASSMREQALEHFSYEVLMRKVLSWMTDVLGGE